MDQEQYPFKLVVTRESGGKPLIKEMRKDGKHGRLYGPSRLWLSIQLTELLLESSVTRRKGKAVRSTQVIIGSGRFETVAKNPNLDIGSVYLFGADKEAYSGGVTISVVEPVYEGVEFFADRPSSESGVFNSEKCWSLHVGVSEEEFNEIIDAMKCKVLNGIAIHFNSKDSPLIFDDGGASSYKTIKLLDDPLRLAMDSDWPLHSDLPLIDLPRELYWPEEFDVGDDLITDFSMLIHKNKTVL